MRVYVVGYAPANDGAATGGFDWFPSPGEAVARARRDLREIGGLGNHSVTYVPLDIPNDVAYPGDQTVVDRDAVTSWIDANLHLVEVGLDDVEVTLPDGEQGRISLGGEPLSAEARAAVESLLEPRERTTTRPSAILRRPDPETPISEATTAELLYEAHQRMGTRPPTFALGSPLNPSDEFDRREEDLARARQATEDAISLHNRAVYRERGVFAITDAERVPDGEDR